MRLSFCLPVCLAFASACSDDDAATDTVDTIDSSSDSSSDTAETTPTGPNWSCLGDPRRPAPSAASLDFPLLTKSALDGSAAAGMEIKVCAGSDLACPTVIDAQTTDAEGKASVTIPMGESGFVGFALITKADYVDTIALANVPIVTPRTAPVNLDVLKTSELALISAALGAVDPTRGQVVVGTWDCGLTPAEGVTLAVAEADARSTRFYIAGALPSKEATETDARGGGGFLNIPVGEAHVTATRAADGAPIGTATVPVVAGKITIVVMVPN